MLADVALGEPPAAVHPTVWMGHFISAGRRRLGHHGLAGGAAVALGAAAVAGGVGIMLDMVIGDRPVVRGLALKPALALRALLEAGAVVERALVAGDVPTARRLLAEHLVSRDTAGLSAADVAGAAISSLAENLNDSVVAPLLAFRVGGLGGAYAYRAINTADAMLGYRTPELEWFGKTAARLDDVVNWVPARLSAGLIAIAAGGGFRVAVADARRTPSPNGGWPMAAMAGALGVVLRKRGVYTLNAGGREPVAADIGRARRIVALAAALAVAL
ncbi:MAG TPA: adenosylcobinamide-phosphate synthase CbiB [Gemmatimonadaceae bacterium]|nr:adenosylcobinamide-phosphate synthase CbiB [Gemmatimonadaceae bacterium]